MIRPECSSPLLKVSQHLAGLLGLRCATFIFKAFCTGWRAAKPMKKRDGTASEIGASRMGNSMVAGAFFSMVARSFAACEIQFSVISI